MTLAAGQDPALQTALSRFEGADLASSLTPAMVGQLPDPVHTAVTTAYADALSPIFLIMVPVFLVAAVVGLFYRQVPLSRQSALAQAAQQEQSTLREDVP